MVEKIKDIFNKLTGKVVIKKEPSGEEYVELEHDGTEHKSAKIIVKYFVITDFMDIKPVIDALREGYTITLLKVKLLKDKDMNELKRAISKLKRTCEAIDGTIVGIDEDWIIAVPNFIEVFKGDSGSGEEGESSED